MMKYRYVNIERTPEVCNVVELPTGHAIYKEVTIKEAKSACRHLNFGGGFDGWTPAFFLQKTNFSYSETEDLL